MTRKACLLSCSQAAPLGGSDTLAGRQGDTQSKNEIEEKMIAPIEADRPELR
jgi:hypothetical protein